MLSVQAGSINVRGSDAGDLKRLIGVADLHDWRADVTIIDMRLVAEETRIKSICSICGRTLHSGKLFSFVTSEEDINLLEIWALGPVADFNYIKA
jgi:hypothetical protein